MILLLESLHAEAEALLESVGALQRAPDPNDPTPGNSAGELPDVRAILTRGRGRISDSLLARCPGLEVIARAGAGLDNLDTAAAARRGIPVLHAPGANTNTVAEHTMALVLDLSRGVTRVARQVSEGRWEERSGYQGNEIAGLTLGIVGLGNIGRRVAHLAQAFGMQVVGAAHSPRAISPPSGVVLVPLDELLAESDVVTLHVPLGESTRGMIGGAQLACMKPGALLVNTARGALVDGVALRAALAGGTLGGFAADVLDVEPPERDDPLLAYERVLLTPHVASLTQATYRNLCVFTAANVVRLLRGEEPDPRSVHRAP